MTKIFCYVFFSSQCNFENSLTLVFCYAAGFWRDVPSCHVLGYISQGVFPVAFPTVYGSGYPSPMMVVFLFHRHTSCETNSTKVLKRTKRTKNWNSCNPVVSVHCSARLCVLSVTDGPRLHDSDRCFVQSFSNLECRSHMRLRRLSSIIDGE